MGKRKDRRVAVAGTDFDRSYVGTRHLLERLAAEFEVEADVFTAAGRGEWYARPSFVCHAFALRDSVGERAWGMTGRAADRHRGMLDMGAREPVEFARVVRDMRFASRRESVRGRTVEWRMQAILTMDTRIPLTRE